MKKSTILAIMAICVLALAVAACGGKKSGNTPARLAKQLNGYLVKGEFDKAVGFWFDNSQKAKEETGENKKETEDAVKVFADKIKAEVDKKGGYKSIEITSETISADGSTAEVAILATYGNGETEEDSHSFVNENGIWKFKNNK